MGYGLGGGGSTLSLFTLTSYCSYVKTVVNDAEEADNPVDSDGKDGSVIY